MNSAPIPIHVSVHGSGAPCFFLHGGPGMDSSYFFPYLEPLTKIFQCHLIDLRGCGRAPRLDRSEYTAENMLQDIEAYRQQCGFEKIVILGHSFGGMLAQKYALKHLQYVHALVLIATAGNNHFVRLLPKIVQNFTQLAVAQVKYMRSPRSDEDFKQMVLASIPLYFTPPFYAEAEQVLQKIHFGAACYEALWSKFLSEFYLRKELHNITCPSLIISAEHDYVIPPKFSEDMKERMPHAEHMMTKNVGHFPFIEAPNECVKMIQQWWENL